MSKKFYSMLLSGTLTMMVVSILLMSDSIIAGAAIGTDAVMGVTPGDAQETALTGFKGKKRLDNPWFH